MVRNCEAKGEQLVRKAKFLAVWSGIYIAEDRPRKTDNEASNTEDRKC